jgi:D-alanyl-lipoteichoic acid acyltransferase DltB (MBOAT superfamily)
MIFNSWTFAVFFIAFYLCYLRLRHEGQNWLLLVASCIFYGYFDARFLLLVLLSAGIDLISGHAISRTQSQTVRFRWVVLAIAGNLLILGIFKYYDFFIENVRYVCAQLGFQVSLATLGVLLPAGISFYTFQSMSYTIDVYRGTTLPCRSARDFAVSVMFFPHLVAGPIQRAGNLIEQVTRPRVLTVPCIRTGLWLLVQGYFLKVVIADNVARIADRAFDCQEPSGATALLGIYAFALQIYCDFAGYSNIARGLANLMGFDLVVNFRQPYFATDPSDFWRRWHISLSTWLRDYLYIPLGGSRGGRLKTCANLLITMLLGGIWHGAGWKFILWGVYHGFLLAALHLIRSLWKKDSSTWRWVRPLQIGIFFQLTCVGWLVFRCNWVSQIVTFPQAILTNFAWSSENLHTLTVLSFLAGPVLLLDLANEYGANLWRLLCPTASGLRTTLLGVRLLLESGAVLMMLFAIFLFGTRGGKPFIYFQF